MRKIVNWNLGSFSLIIICVIKTVDIIFGCYLICDLGWLEEDWDFETFNFNKLATFIRFN
jgi:hypothetical protein